MKQAKPKQQKKRGREHSLWRVGAIAAIAILAILGVSSFAYAQTLRGKILPGVLVADVNVGGHTPEQAQVLLLSRLERFEREPVTITYRDKVFQPKLSELGIAIDLASTIDMAFASGRSGGLSQFFALPAFAREQALPVQTIVDAEDFQNYLQKVTRHLSIPAQNAALVVADGTVVVRPGVVGSKVVIRESMHDVGNAVAYLQPVKLSAVQEDQVPAITEQETTAALPEFLRRTAQSVSLFFGVHRYTASTDDLRQWIELVPDASGTESTTRFSINKERSREFFAAIANDVNINPKETVGFLAAAYGEYAYKNSEGRSVDLETTHSRLLEELERPTQKAVEVAVRIEPPIITYENPVAPKTQGKVIHVDLAKQAIFAYEDGKLAYWTRVSTGKGAFATPTGEWKIYAKTPVQVMDGPGYYLPGVKWVMPYNGDYTLHTAYWHTNFGTPMSHGCTNMSEADAKWFYDWAEKGTPVVIS